MPRREKDLQAQGMDPHGVLHFPSHLPRLLWEAKLVPVDLVAPVGVVDHQKDLQEDHQEVMEVTLEMDIPGVRFPDMGTQFQ